MKEGLSSMASVLNSHTPSWHTPRCHVLTVACLELRCRLEIQEARQSLLSLLISSAINLYAVARKIKCDKKVPGKYILLGSPYFARLLPTHIYSVLWESLRR